MAAHNFPTFGNTVFEKAVEALEIFSCKTTIISGPGAVAKLTHWAPKRLFLVTDPFFAKNGNDVTSIAVRAARAHTHRKKIVFFKGYYHGGEKHGCENLVGDGA